MVRDKKLVLLYLVFGLFSLVYLVSAQPSTPVNVEGFIFHENGSGVENGIPIIITNNNTQTNFTTVVSAPPIPFFMGAYSTTIEGATGHILIVRAYNDTSYGETSGMISSAVQQINVTMNISRSPETNVSITSPSSSSSFDVFASFNLSFDVEALVDDLVSCEATIFFSNDSVFNSSNNILNLGNISFATTDSFNFEVDVLSTGSSNISVSVSCANTDIFFEGNKQDTIFNIEGTDGVAPVVTIISPLNESEEKGSNNILIEYNVSHPSTVEECRLYINETLNQTSSSIVLDQPLSFNTELENNDYTFRIECEDSFSQNGTSDTFLIFIRVHFPSVLSVSLEEIINLNAGSTKTVICNASIEDLNGFDDIALVNATFFNDQSTGINNNSNHYTNESCNQLSFSGNTANYECSFSVLYYATNGSWTCNITATDNQGLTGTDLNETIIDTLFALNISQLLINYGDVEAGFLSDEIPLNITNIGNQNINVDVRGFGGQNEASGEGVAMICDSSQNISLSNKRYSNLAFTTFESKNNLTSTNTFTGIQVPKQNNELLQIQSIFWQLRAPPGPVLENCVGTVVFTATTT